MGPLRGSSLIVSAISISVGCASWRLTSRCCSPRRRRIDRGGTGARQRRGRARLGERVGGVVRLGSLAVRWAVGAQRPDPDPGAGGRAREADETSASQGV